MKRVEFERTSGMHAGWFAFALLWFGAVVIVVAVILQTPAVYAAPSPEILFDRSETFLSWMLLAGGALVGMTGFATTWLLVSMDACWLLPPFRGGRRPGKEPRRKRPRGWDGGARPEHGHREPSQRAQRGVGHARGRTT